MGRLFVRHRIALTATALVLAGCSGASAPAATPALTATSAPAPATGGGGTASKQFTIGLAAGKVGNPGAREIYAGFTSEARKLGMTVKINDANLDVNKQISDIDQFTNQKVDAIAIHLIGDPKAVQGAVSKAQAQGIHIFSFDEEEVFPNIEVLAYQNTAEEGKQSAAYIAKQLNDKGSVIVTGGPPVPVLERRYNAAVEEFKKHPNITVLPRQDIIPDDAAGGRQVGEQLLAKYQNLDAIWTENDEIAQGVGAAVKAAGRKVIVTGINGDQEGIDAIKQGTMDATWDSLGTDFGMKAADAAFKILGGETPKTSLPVRIFPTPILYTKDNVNQWVPPELRVPYPGELKGA
ncbi:MAG: sugar ABC transporter substrate-binding protein [Chloroflexi bacterium]|nr:sugar ABC transporter substrate-binding protein [Chloroflexota bacterium]